MQNALLASLGRIERLQEKTVESLEKTHQTLQGVKKETSEDSLKELANLGVTNFEEGWQRAFATGNARIMQLLLASNSKPNHFLLTAVLTSENYSTGFSTLEILQLLRTITPNVQKAICRKDPNKLDARDIASAVTNIGINEYQFYCGPPVGVWKWLKADFLVSWEWFCKDYVKRALQSCQIDDIDNIVENMKEPEARSKGQAIRAKLKVIEVIRRAERSE